MGIEVTGIEIRRAALGDLSHIAELLGMLARTPLSLEDARNRVEMIERDPDQEMWVAVCDGEVVGLLAFRIRHNVERVSHYGEISALAVSEAHRRSGIGRRLIDQAETIARERNCIGLWLVSGNARKAEAREFYRQLGFDGTGTRFVRMF